MDQPARNKKTEELKVFKMKKMLHGSWFVVQGRPRRGQAIVEALVAISALTIGFLGILSLLSQSLSLNRVVSNNYAANYLASEGIETVKNIMDANIITGRNWLSGLAEGDHEAVYNSTSLDSYQGRTLSYDPASSLYSYSGSVQTPFVRKITLASVGTAELKVVSEVSWTDRGGANFKVTLEDHFYHWHP